MQQNFRYSITSSALACRDCGIVTPICLGGLQINHQLIFGRRLHRQIGRFLALEDAIDAYADSTHLHAKRLRRALDRAELADAGGYCRIAKDCHPFYLRRDLLEELHPLPAQTVFEIHKASGIAAWPS